jgi:uncharacterized membrane protein YdjX (TVP38/TMEM64 family)
MTPDGNRSPSSLQRWLPLVALVTATVVVFAMGWHKLLSFETVGRNYEDLRAFIESNLAVSLLLYALLYIVVVALSLPGGLVMTLAGGLLFGWKIGAPATVIAATLGAVLLFLAAKTSLGDALAARAGPWLGRLRDGFKDNALSYMLFLRLVPVFPFFIVNLAPALLGVPLSTFAIGTFFGIIPGTVAFSVAGSGLGSVVEAQNAVHAGCLARQASEPSLSCPYTIDTSSLITGELLAAFVLIGLVALIPVAAKKWSARNAAR